MMRGTKLQYFEPGLIYVHCPEHGDYQLKMGTPTDNIVCPECGR